MRVARQTMKGILLSTTVVFISSTLVFGQGASEKPNSAKTKAESEAAERHFKQGLVYATGQNVITNYGEAFYWFSKAAEEGHSLAQYNVGVFYLNGMGVLRNPQEAVRFLKKAADQGLPRAQAVLGGCYMRGLGVGEDYDAGVALLREASRQGDDFAKQVLANVSSPPEKPREKPLASGSTFKTRRGKTYENATVFARMPDAILIKYRSASGSSGVAHIRYEDITDEMREEFELTSEGVANYRNDQARNEALRAAFQLQERERIAAIERQNIEVRQRAEAERVAEYNRQLEAYNRQQEINNQAILIDQLNRNAFDQQLQLDELNRNLRNLDSTLEMQRLDRMIWRR